jgi:hypothetical protein
MDGVVVGEISDLLSMPVLLKDQCGKDELYCCFSAHWLKKDCAKHINGEMKSFMAASEGAKKKDSSS